MKSSILLSTFLTTLLILNLSNATPPSSSSLQQECAEDFQKLMSCLSFATGQATTPKKECCTSVKDIKESDAKCLCYIMQQTHNGSAQIKSLGIQEAKLLQLPNACQLQNASTSFCLKLLGIPAGSPDAAIFTSNSTTPPSTSSPSTPATTTPTASDSKSDGFKPKTTVAAPLIVAVLVFISVLLSFN